MLLFDIIQQHLRNFGPVGCAIFGCLLTGLLINQPPNIVNSSIQLDKDIKCNTTRLSSPSSSSSSSSSLSTSWTTNFIITFSAILPLIPLLLIKNPTTAGVEERSNVESIQNFQKTNAFVSHVLGQSATFAGNEFIKHFLISPDPLFFEKCNSSIEVCLAKRLQNVPVFLASTTLSSSSSSTMSANAPITFTTALSLPLVDANKTAALSLDDKTTANITQFNNQTFAFCSNSSLPMSDIFASLHSMPNVVFSMIGASAILFLANLYLWKQSNLSNSELSSSDNARHCCSNNLLQQSDNAICNACYTTLFSKPISHVKVFFVLIFCLFISAVFIYKQTQSLNNNLELFTSFLYGVGLQLLIFALFQWKYFTKNNTTNIITTTPATN